MLGTRTIETINREIPATYYKMASFSLSVDYTPTKRSGVGRRVGSLVFVVLVTLSLTIARAFGVVRGAVPRPAAPPPAEVVNKAEQHLLEIGYWSGPVRDTDAVRAHYAILAFQRVEGRNQTGKLNAADAQVAIAATRPIPRETGYSHIEVDLQRQVLFVVDQKIGVTLVLPVSSGSEKLYTFEGKTSRAVTPRGRFTVYSEVKGWRKAPLGMIYYPNYFK